MSTVSNMVDRLMANRSAIRTAHVVFLLALLGAGFTLDANGNIAGMARTPSIVLTIVLFLLAILSAVWIVVMDPKWRLLAILSLLFCAVLLFPLLL